MAQPASLERGEPRRINLTSTESATSTNQRHADAVAGALKATGDLRGYHIDVVVVDGVAELHGRVADASQRELAGKAAAGVAGIERVDNRLNVGNGAVPAAAQELVPNGPGLDLPNVPFAAPAPTQLIPPGPPAGMAMPLPPGAMPPGAMLPPAEAGQFGAALAPAPAPVYQPQPGMMPNPQYQPPPLPPYAWPTYAPHNNYSRVAHPLLYAYNQWPFIGPMYPYPKVPLGWRRVTLEWQDGAWWYGREATSHSWWRVRYW